MEHDAGRETPLEELFRRWRETGDGEALAEVLARTEDELLALARRRAPDAEAALDLVQETWRTVVAQARRWDAEQRLMPWLVGLLQIEARRARRSAARSVEPDRLHRAEPADAATLAESRELFGVVRERLRGLPGIYSEVLDMHLLQELSHAEIAARTGREPGTVRVQVFRGLAQLRRHLPAGLSLGAALAGLAPRGEAARAARVLDEAADGAPGAPAWPGDVLGAAPAAAWGAWAAGAAVLAALGLGAWLALRAPSNETDAWARGPTAPAAPGAERGASLAGPEDAGSASARRAAAETGSVSPARDGVWLVVELEGLTALPRAATALVLRRQGETPWRVEVAGSPAQVDLAPWFGAGGPAPREFLVEADHPHALPARGAVRLDDEGLAGARAAAAGAGRSELAVHLVLTPPVARVHGRLAWAPALGPAAADRSAVVALFEADAAGDPGADPVEGRRVAPDGSFALRAVRAGRHILVAAPANGDGRPATLALDLLAGAERDVGLVVLEAGASIAGRVSTAPRAGSRTAWVSWRLLGAPRLLAVHGTPLAWSSGRFERPGDATPIAADGSFAIGGLAPGAECALRVLAGPEQAAQPAHAAAVHDPSPSELQVQAPAVGVVLLAEAVPDDGTAAPESGTIVLAAPGVVWTDALCRVLPAEGLDLEAVAALRRGEVPPGAEVLRREVGADGALAAPAGRVWILITARREATEGLLAHARPLVAEVEVAPRGTTRVPLEPELLGRLRFAPVAAQPGAERVALELLDERGGAVPIAVTSLVLRGDARHGRVTTPGALPFGAHGTSSLLAPGAYVVRATIGPRTIERAVIVAAGRTTDVALDAP
ncbi:MAG: sigma-70 family RNA polymerase sigma factor [Planctomycetes bacterium]|nr:sigma-70 family RNA polymerase sigma factor [Planctomycetota bacterium]